MTAANGRVQFSRIQLASFTRSTYIHDVSVQRRIKKARVDRVLVLLPDRPLKGKTLVFRSEFRTKLRLSPRRRLCPLAQLQKGLLDDAIGGTRDYRQYRQAPPGDVWTQEHFLPKIEAIRKR